MNFTGHHRVSLRVIVTWQCLQGALHQDVSSVAMGHLYEIEKLFPQ